MKQLCNLLSRNQVHYSVMLRGRILAKLRNYNFIFIEPVGFSLIILNNNQNQCQHIPNDVILF